MRALAARECAKDWRVGRDDEGRPAAIFKLWDGGDADLVPIEEISGLHWQVECALIQKLVDEEACAG